MALRKLERDRLKSDFNVFPHKSFYLMTNEAIQYKSWMCLICGWIYSEEAGLPDEGIAPGTQWEDVPVNCTCPECGARKDDFEMVQV